MSTNRTRHTFHIPVMGIGFTIDSPIKVAHLGIDSSMSMVDDLLVEKMRQYYCEKYKMAFIPISNKVEDHRAKRITAYLDMSHDVVQHNVDKMKSAATEEDLLMIKKYVDLLSPDNDIKKFYEDALEENGSDNEYQALLKIKDRLPIGSIDINIMTKMDRENYKGKETLPAEFNDAHAAFRGFAKSKLSASVVLSAGMNPRLYSYIEQFEDFYPTADDNIKKKIILKVSDYRSALIQGKFLAKKGIWISEYRIESGLNCGGHAFATDGFLMGPILEEFKTNRTDLINSVFEVYQKALTTKERYTPSHAPRVKFTAQGGVGTHQEHEFLLNHYQLDSIGWGTPFLLVPEAVSVDRKTEQMLAEAKEKDLYLSDISPLGVPFNTLKGNTMDVQKDKRIADGKPGSPCVKKHAKLSKEFEGKALCTASRTYQNLKIKQLVSQDLSQKKFDNEYAKIVAKSCICVGLGTSALLANDLDHKLEGTTVSICPGPNLAYFSESVSLSQMVGHIYGSDNVMHRTDRPNLFVKELSIYVEYLEGKIKEWEDDLSPKNLKYIDKFANNLQEGIAYYILLFSSQVGFEENASSIEDQLKFWSNRLTELKESTMAMA